MTKPEDSDTPKTIKLYKTLQQPCAYIDGQLSTSIVPDPTMQMTHHCYEQLAEQGFRRSGDEVYKPDCPQCSACRPIRIPIPYSPNRSQKRTSKLNQNLSSRLLTPEFNPEHFDLYTRYLKARHAKSQMAETSQENYQEFLISSWCKSIFIEFREEEKLLAVAVTDVFQQALSAVYTFFDPDLPRRSLGTYCVLNQLALAEEMRIKPCLSGVLDRRKSCHAL